MIEPQSQENKGLPVADGGASPLEHASRLEEKERIAVALSGLPAES